MLDNNTIPAKLRLGWLLYADVVTRCNLLIDECAHLQQTIHNHLPTTKPEVLGLQHPGAGAEGQQRPWIPASEKIRDHSYYLKRPQERALRNLYATVGALAEAITQNSESLKSSFAQVVQHTFRPIGGQSAGPDKEASDAFYWFISLRGHYLGSTFDYYLKHLQHAQEKLIQLLENSPGTLPGPTLLRRWSSGGLGEFLSEYSRQVNAQIQFLLWKKCQPQGAKSFDAWRMNQYLVHTWSHSPTSLTTRNWVEQGTEGAGKVSLTTIWSSYFYLEQPILFPLLYHECAHHYAHPERAAQTDPASAEAPVDGRTEGSRKLWYGRAREAAALLTRTSPLEELDIGFWPDFVGEVWSDAVSLSLCGTAYLVPLMLQVFGLQDRSHLAYSDYDLATEEKVPLNRLGQVQRRSLPVHYPVASLGYFWEARAALAIKVCRTLQPGCQDAQTWCDAFETLLTAWQDSGQHAHAAQLASHEHQTYWAYRGSLNQWVADTVWSCLADFVETDLKSASDEQARQGEFIIEPGLLNVVAKDVNNYARVCMSIEPAADFAFNTKARYRLEDLCPSIRWWVAGRVIEKLAVAYQKDDQPSSAIQTWLGTYIHYLSCDGSVAFRLAMEWLTIQRDMLVTAARLVAEPEQAQKMLAPSGLSPSERGFAMALQQAVLQDAARHHHVDLALQQDKSLVLDLVKYNFRTIRGRWTALAGLVDESHQRFVDALQNFANAKEDCVGTFTLGVVRPHYMQVSGGYGAALRSVGKYVNAVHGKRHKEIEGADLGSFDSTCQFYPLFGEYGFGVYQPGLASINKASYPAAQPPILLKPRGVLKVSGDRAREPAHGGFVRVSQVSFKYRWQWLCLFAELAEGDDLFLSSAWEDLILVTHHPSLQAFKEQVTQKNLRPRPWLDIHSSIGLCELPAEDPPQAAQPAKPASMAYVDRWRHYQLGSIAERTGRYDITVRWDGADSPAALWQLLNTVPAQEWEAVYSIVTALEMSVGEDGAERFTFTSQIMMRH